MSTTPKATPPPKKPSIWKRIGTGIVAGIVAVVTAGTGARQDD